MVRFGSKLRVFPVRILFRSVYPSCTEDLFGENFYKIVHVMANTCVTSAYECAFYYPLSLVSIRTILEYLSCPKTLRTFFFLLRYVSFLPRFFFSLSLSFRSVRNTYVRICVSLSTLQQGKEAGVIFVCSSSR